MKKLTIITLVSLCGFVALSATISRVGTGFKTAQKRQINNSLGEIETAVTATEIASVVVDTNVTTTATGYTPAKIGQLLTGGAGAGTNAMWVAEGLTTNDWVQVSSYVE